MSELDDAFAFAQEDVKKLTANPSNDDLQRLYGLFKQATKGDVDGDKPGRFDIVNRKKYEGWERLKGTSTDDAKQGYVDLVAKLRKG